MLVTISLDGEPTIAGVSSFTGMGTSVVVSGDRLLLADGDRGVRIFDTTESAPTLLAVDEIGGAP